MFKNILLLLSLLLLFSACSDTQDNEQIVEEANSMVASNVFMMRDIQGKEYEITKIADEYTVKGYENRVVIYDIFATWCPPCRAIAPYLAKFAKEFKDDVLVLGITIEEGKSNGDLMEYADAHDAHYPILNSAQNRTLANALASSVHIGSGFPIPLIIIYKNGRYFTHYAGAVPPEMIHADIKKALGK